jgi:hypothetical protein
LRKAATGDRAGIRRATEGASHEEKGQERRQGRRQKGQIAHFFGLDQGRCDTAAPFFMALETGDVRCSLKI